MTQRYLTMAKREKGRHPIQDAGRSWSAEFPLRRDLKDDAVPVGAATRRSTPEVAVRVEDQVRWAFTVRSSGKVVDVGVGPTAVRRRHLENAIAVYAVEVSGCICNLQVTCAAGV